MALALTELVKNTYIANKTEPILELVLEFVVWKKCTYLQMYLNKNRPFWEVNNIMFIGVDETDKKYLNHLELYMYFSKSHESGVL